MSGKNNPLDRTIKADALNHPYRLALVVAGVAAAYFVTGRLLIVLGAPPNGAVTTVWLPSGITVAGLLLFGPLAAIGSFFGSLALDLKMDHPLAAGLIVAVANAGSELMCYYLIVGRNGRTLSIVGVREVLRFVVAAVVAAVISAFIGVSAYAFFAVIPANVFWPTWLTWFGSTAIGIVLITPFLVYAVRGWPSFGKGSRYFECIAALTVLAAAAFLWQGPAFSRTTDEPVLLIVILVLLWIAFRFPPAAMTQAVFVFAVAGVAGAVLRLSHEPAETAFVSIFALQLMLGGLAVIGYLLDSVVTDQRRAAEALRADIGKRKQAEGEIRRLNIELEHKVEERTRQLLEAQEELVRKEKLAILGQLSGSVGHELRNPLGVISNAVYFLKMVLADSDEKVHEYLGIIKKEIDISLRIITDLLDFARTKPPQLQKVTARALVDECLGRCTIPSNVEVRDEVPSSLPLLKVDPLQIGQVLDNLITNGIQAMPDGGMLIIRGEREQERTVRLEVVDTGEGITAGNMKKLFQPLFTTKTRGIGLGLVVCRNLTEVNGGRIEVESEPGKGTLFTLRFPMAGDDV